MHRQLMESRILESNNIQINMESILRPQSDDKNSNLDQKSILFKVDREDLE